MESNILIYHSILILSPKNQIGLVCYTLFLISYMFIRSLSNRKMDEVKLRMVSVFFKDYIVIPF